MRETGFSIWLEEICSTQAEAARLLGITDRSVRRYKNGERPVPTPVAKLMTVTVLALFRPELDADPFYEAGSWPDDPDDARALLDHLLLPVAEWINFDGGEIPDIQPSGPQKSDARTIGPQNSSGPQKSDSWTIDPQNSNGPQKSHTRTIGPQYSSSPQKTNARTDGLQNSDTQTAGQENSWAVSSLKSWFRWRRPTDDQAA